MQISSYTHVGTVRKINEDACLAVPPWSRLAIQKRACLFAVADGMGGHNAGEVASTIAVNALRDWFAEAEIDQVDERLFEEVFAATNSLIWDYSQKNPETSGMGTTLTAMVVKGKSAIIGHIGDSRLYRMRGGKLELITNDHSLVAEQVRMGKLTPEQARVHPTRNILSRVMGGRQFVVPDCFQIEVEPEDLFLICSDGVTGMIDDNQITKMLLEQSPSRVARALCDQANKDGGKDNSTAVVLKIDKLPIVFPSAYSFSRLCDLFVHWREAGTV